MTLAALHRRIEHFQRRVRVTTPGTAPHTRAANCLRVAERMLLCYQATGSVAGWHKYHIIHRRRPMDTIKTLAQAMDAVRRKFTRGEQSMLIDIYNGVALCAPYLGNALLGQVEDAFAMCYGVYEGKYGVDSAAMLQKIRALNIRDAAMLELWAVTYWQLHESVPDSLSAYLKGALTLSSHLESLADDLIAVSERLEKTKSSFKSAAVAEARAMVDAIIKKLL